MYASNETNEQNLRLQTSYGTGRVSVARAAVAAPLSAAAAPLSAAIEFAVHRLKFDS
jgi:hypothetical protein